MRTVLAAFAALLSSAALSSAQTPFAAPAEVEQTAGTVFATGPGCAACDTPRAKKAGLVRIGAGCAMPIGCSNLAAERTFLFGSCRQFYNPGGDCGGNSFLFGGCGGQGLVGGGAYGAGRAGCGTGNCGGGGWYEKHPCAGVTSYLNR